MRIQKTDEEQQRMMQTHSTEQERLAEMLALESDESATDDELDEAYDLWEEAESASEKATVANFVRLGLNTRGRSVTERRLRELYQSATDDDDKGELAFFLLHWHSKRALAVGDDWLRGDPSDWELSTILLRFGNDIKNADRFLAILAQEDLSDFKRFIALDRFSDLIEYRQRHPRFSEFVQIIADHLEHACALVRGIAIIKIAKLGAKQYREMLVELQSDRAQCSYGYVSALARNGVRVLDGEEDVDLWDAGSP